MVRALLLFLAISTVAAIASAQSYSVSEGTINGGYADIASPTNVNLSSGTLSNVIKPSGFSVDFFGTTYSEFKIASGGYLLMGPNGTVISKGPQVTTAPGLVITPAWMYLDPTRTLAGPTTPTNPGPGTIGWSATNSTLEVEWKNIPTASNPTIGVRMKLVMDLATGAIEFHYGQPHAGATGATSAVKNTACIAGPTATTPQEIINGSISGAINNDGSISAWPTDRFTKFTPGSTTPTNTPPVVTAATPGGLIQVNGTVNVNYGVALSALAISVTVADADGNPCTLTGTVSNKGATGLVDAEWSSTSAAVPYTLNPASGVFNTPAGATHAVSLSANDGNGGVTNFNFNIVQSPQSTTAPVLGVSDGAGVAYGQSAAGSNRDFGSRDITAGASTPLSITVSNSGNADLSLLNIALTGDASHFVLDTTTTTNPVTQGTSTTFSVSFSPLSAGQKVAQVVFNHNDTTETDPFSFEITGLGTQVATAPLIVVKETNALGAVIANGGIHNFGSMDITQTPSAPFTIFIQNGGNADLTVGMPASSSGDFTVTAGSFPATIPSGGNASFQVTFTPAIAGPYSASLSFSHNDSTTADPYTINLSGTATTGGTPPGGTAGFGGGGGGGGGCVASSGYYAFWILLLALGASLGARIIGRRAEG